MVKKIKQFVFATFIYYFFFKWGIIPRIGIIDDLKARSYIKMKVKNSGLENVDARDVLVSRDNTVNECVCMPKISQNQVPLRPRSEYFF